MPSATPSSAVAAASMMTERASGANISNSEKASNTEEMPISTIIDFDSNIVHLFTESRFSVSFLHWFLAAVTSVDAE